MKTVFFVSCFWILANQELLDMGRQRTAGPEQFSLHKNTKIDCG